MSASLSSGQVVVLKSKIGQVITSNMCQKRSTSLSRHNAERLKDEREKYCSSPKIIYKYPQPVSYHTIEQNSARLYVINDVLTTNNANETEELAMSDKGENLHNNIPSGNTAKNKFCHGPKMIVFRTKLKEEIIEDSHKLQHSNENPKKLARKNIFYRNSTKLKGLTSQKPDLEVIETSKTFLTKGKHINEQTRFCNGLTMIVHRSKDKCAINNETKNIGQTDKVQLQTSKAEMVTQPDVETVKSVGGIQKNVNRVERIAINKCRLRFCNGPQMIAYQPKHKSCNKNLEGMCQTIDEYEKSIGRKLRSEDQDNIGLKPISPKITCYTKPTTFSENINVSKKAISSLPVMKSNLKENPNINDTAEYFSSDMNTKVEEKHILCDTGKNVSADTEEKIKINTPKSSNSELKHKIQAIKNKIYCDAAICEPVYGSLNYDGKSVSYSGPESKDSCLSMCRQRSKNNQNVPRCNDQKRTCSNHTSAENKTNIISNGGKTVANVSDTIIKEQKMKYSQQVQTTAFTEQTKSVIESKIDTNKLDCTHCGGCGEKTSSIRYAANSLFFATKLAIAASCILLTVKTGVWSSPNYPKTTLELVQDETSQLYKTISNWLTKFMK